MAIEHLKAFILLKHCFFFAFLQTMKEHILSTSIPCMGAYLSFRTIQLGIVLSSTGHTLTEVLRFCFQKEDFVLQKRFSTALVVLQISQVSIFTALLLLIDWTMFVPECKKSVRPLIYWKFWNCVVKKFRIFWIVFMELLILKLFINSHNPGLVYNISYSPLCQECMPECQLFMYYTQNSIIHNILTSVSEYMEKMKRRYRPSYVRYVAKNVGFTAVILTCVTR